MAELNGQKKNLVVPWEKFGIAQVQQDQEDHTLVKFWAITVETPTGNIIFPITQYKNSEPPVGLQVALQTTSQQFLNVLNELQLWDRA